MFPSCLAVLCHKWQRKHLHSVLLHKISTLETTGRMFSQYLETPNYKHSPTNHVFFARRRTLFVYWSHEQAKKILLKIRKMPFSLDIKETVAQRKISSPEKNQWEVTIWLENALRVWRLAAAGCIFAGSWHFTNTKRSPLTRALSLCCTHTHRPVVYLIQWQ